MNHKKLKGSSSNKKSRKEGIRTKITSKRPVTDNGLEDTVHLQVQVHSETKRRERKRDKPGQKEKQSKQNLHQKETGGEQTVLSLHSFPVVFVIHLIIQLISALSLLLLLFLCFKFLSYFVFCSGERTFSPFVLSFDWTTEKWKRSSMLIALSKQT